MLARGLVHAEVVHGEQAVVLARLAAHGLVRGREGRQLLEREQGRAHRGGRGQLVVLGAPRRPRLCLARLERHGLVAAVAGEQRGAERAHVAGDVGAHGLDLGQLLERAQHSVVQERAALHDDLRAHVVRVADLYDLEQRVLDDGDGKARGDVAHGGAFLLRLLHAAVHEHGAAAAQVDRALGAHCRLRELGHVQVEARGEALDEAAAARAARLVEHDVVDDAVLHAQALHVLAADVQDELHARQHLLRTAQVRHRLDLAGVHAQRLQQQVLAVARHRGVADAHERLAGVGVHRHGVVQVRERRAGAAQHVALVAGVMRPQKRAVLADERGLERGGAGVDAKVGRALVVHEAAATHAFAVVASFELGVLLIAGEQRGQAHHLGALDVAEALQAVEHVAQKLGTRRLAGRARDGAAAGHEQVGVVGHDDVLVVQLQRLVEALAQLGEVLQRAAEEGHVAADGAAARQAADGLRHHRLEDGRGDVLLARALVDERLHVGLREHAATAGDGIQRGRALRQHVQAAGVGVQERGHLVDEGARAAGARAVHALFDALVEVDDLRILAAQLDGHVGGGDEGFHRRLAGDDLLHELDAQPLGEQQAARARDGDGHALVAEVGCGLREHFHDGGAHVGVMAAIDGELHVVRRIEDGQLHRGGPHVDADMQRDGLHGSAFSRRHSRPFRAVSTRQPLAGSLVPGLHAPCPLFVGVHGLVRHDALLHRFLHRVRLLGLRFEALQFDRFARLDEEQPHGDQRHLLRALLHARLDPPLDHAQVRRGEECHVVADERRGIVAVALVQDGLHEVGAHRVAQARAEAHIATGAEHRVQEVALLAQVVE